MKIRRSRLPAVALLTAVLTTAVAVPADATVIFGNTGLIAGWNTATPQRAGTITEVSSPVYKGSTALRMRQIYQTSDGKRYHSEVVKTGITVGLDRYYGQAVYIPADWVFHNQDIVIQQWATESPSSPWLGMDITNNQLVVDKVRGSGQFRQAIATMPRGQWVRIVTRLNTVAAGILEIWVNGTKVLSSPGDWSANWNGSATMRWSTGIYCGAWSTVAPAGQTDLSVWHDNLRLTSTYAEADPGSWG